MAPPSIDTTVVGLAVVKINGQFYLDVKNATWSVKRAIAQAVTGGGLRQGIGVPIPACTFDSVIPRSKDLDWTSLANFSVEILDKEQKKTLFAMTGCNWNSGDGSSDQAQANTGKRVAIMGNEVTKW